MFTNGGFTVSGGYSKINHIVARYAPITYSLFEEFCQTAIIALLLFVHVVL